MMPYPTGNVCSVCSHRSRKEIDAAIAGGVSTLAGLSRRYGMSRQSLMRHRDTHMGRDIKAVQARARDDAAYDRGSTLLDRMHQLGADAKDALEEAKHLKDTRLILAAIGTASKLLELQGKLEGDIGTGGTTNINVTMNDFRTLQINIVSALEGFPEAKAAVLKALSADDRTLDAEDFGGGENGPR